LLNDEDETNKGASSVASNSRRVSIHRGSPNKSDNPFEV